MVQFGDTEGVKSFVIDLVTDSVTDLVTDSVILTILVTGTAFHLVKHMGIYLNKSYKNKAVYTAASVAWGWAGAV